MTVELRSRLLKNGNKTLYLDFYENGKRWYEYLDLYIVPGNTPAIKKENEGTMNKAIAIKAKRILGIEDDPEPLANGELPKRVFADWLMATIRDWKKKTVYQKARWKTWIPV